MDKYQLSFQVAAALIRQGERVLLVKQQGSRDPSPTWALPGGGVELGELLTHALIREVREETGLRVLDVGRLLYLTQIYTAETGRMVTAFIFGVDRWEGEIKIDDPDRLILDARFMDCSETLGHLAHQPFSLMRDPIVAFLRHEAPYGTVWLYRRELNGQVSLVQRYPAGMSEHDFVRESERCH